MIERRILIVDDEPGARLILERSLGRNSFQVTSAQSGEEALDLFKKSPFPVVVTDINMPGMNGIELIREIRALRPETCVLIMTAYADLDSAIEALRAGAYDYIVKPFKPDLMVKNIERAFEQIVLKDEVRYLKSQIEEQYGFESIIGASESLKQSIRIASRIAPTDESVLITGASGTGKELFARAIHVNSLRKENRFIAVNCGALPEQLIESELFGHKRGSFTGALTDKQGLVQEADGGTIFLDEIAEIPQMLQVKLLRFLQDHNIRPLGALKETFVNVRVIAATNRTLEEEVQAGRFREDLYYRLRVLEIRIATLKERPTDIPILLNHFLDKFARRTGRKTLEIPDDVMKTLISYDWPGNVREVENLAKHLVIMCEGEVIEMKDLPPFLQSTPQKPPGNFLIKGEKYSEIRSKVLEDFNQAIITEALELEDWNISRAAERLGTAKSNVLRLMKRFNLPRKQDQDEELA